MFAAGVPALAGNALTNATVPAGATASFGMQGTFTASDAVPTSFTLTADNGQTVTCAAG
jgi:hypothetical protein